MPDDLKIFQGIIKAEISVHKKKTKDMDTKQLLKILFHVKN